MRRFYLDRKEDVSGVSGCGRVAEGVLFWSGKCVINWFGNIPSLETYDNIESLEKIHGHEGRTKIEWQDEGQG